MAIKAVKLRRRDSLIISVNANTFIIAAAKKQKTKTNILPVVNVSRITSVMAGWGATPSNSTDANITIKLARRDPPVVRPQSSATMPTKHESPMVIIMLNENFIVSTSSTMSMPQCGLRARTARSSERHLVESVSDGWCQSNNRISLESRLGIGKLFVGIGP